MNLEQQIKNMLGGPGGGGTVADALLVLAQGVDALVERVLALELCPAERDAMLAKMHLLSPEEEERVTDEL